MYQYFFLLLLNKMNIMVVIYNSLIRLPMVRDLSSGGNNVIPATDVNSALEKMAEESINCVVLDLNLPSIINGIDLLKKIKKDYPDMKIIIINSNLDEKVISVLGKMREVIH